LQFTYRCITIEPRHITTEVQAVNIKPTTRSIGFFLPDEVKEGLRAQAERESRTMTSLLIHLIRTYLQEQEEVRALKARRQAERAA
jgi:predicted DNA-binding protein